MLTRKLKLKQKGQVYGFLRWPEESHFEQREIQTFTSLGRDADNLIALQDDFVSRRHCRIQRQDPEGFILQDMNSRNGTFLNGNRIFKAVLRHNDRIQIGRKEFVFSFNRFENHLQAQSKNPNFNKKLKTLPPIAQSDMPVLITGPCGTGKEKTAHFIHQHSTRNKGPMISINCSALSESLIESEFFGHVRGSYTGALTHRKGAFVAARGGSLFLDEIGDLPLPLQPKLLRAIEYQEVKPVGSDHITKTDVRIIAATHQDLKQKVRHQGFRQDLYFRLHVLPFELPALKDRMEDFEDLLDLFSREYGVCFSESATEFLKRYSWPGNIRELKNTVARATALFAKTRIELSDVKQLIPSSGGEAEPSPPSVSPDEKALTTPPSSPFGDRREHSSHPSSIRHPGPTAAPPRLKDMEKAIILKYLMQNRGNRTKTAEDLGIPTSTLCDRIKAFHIHPEHFRLSP